MRSRLTGADADSSGRSEVPRSEAGASAFEPGAVGPDLATTGVAPFVGRARELSVLRAAVADTLDGRGRLVLLAGEAGIGKTRTAEEVAAHASQRGMQVLWGRCYEGEGAPAFWPWVQLLRAASRRLQDDALRAALGWGGAELTQLVPELRERLPDLDAAAAADSAQARFRLFESVARFLENLSRQAPLVCIIDDLHGGDRSSLRLLEFVARELRDVSTLLVGTYRDGAAMIGHPLTELVVEALRLPGVERLTLSGLSLEEVAELVERTSGVRPAQSMVAAVYQQTEGNPLFAGEYVRLLLARHDQSALADSQALRSLPVPDSVRAVVRHRVAPLSSTCRAALNVAAVIGREFHRDVVETVVAADARVAADASVFAALDEAAAAGIVGEGLERGGRYRFAHAVMRETLYEELGNPQRQQLHRRVGEVLEQRRDADEHLAELAYHFFQAGAGTDRVSVEADTAKAVAYARRAGERAMASMAYEEAIRLYQLALAGCASDAEGDAVRCSVLVKLGVAQNAAGDLDVSKQTLLRAAELAKRLGLRDELATAALHFGTKLAWGDGALDRVQVELIESALTQWNGSDTATEAQLLARLALSLVFSGDHERQEAASQHALDLARRIGDPVTLVAALNARHATCYGSHTWDERVAIAAEIIETAEPLPDLEMVFHGHAWRCDAFLEVGDRTAFDAVLATRQHLAEKLRQPFCHWVNGAVRASLLILEGRFAEGERQAQAALAIGQAITPGAVVGYATQTLTLGITQGRRDTLEAVGQMMRAYASEYPALPVVSTSVAHIAAVLGLEDEARVWFERFAATGFRELPLDQNWLMAVGQLAATCTILADAPRAAQLYALLSPFELRTVVVPSSCIYHGPVAHYLGTLAALLERRADAVRHFETALAINTRMRARPWLAYTQYEYARALLAGGEPGDHAKGRDLLSRALATAHELDMKSLEERVAGLLESTPPSAITDQSRSSSQLSAVSIQQPETRDEKLETRDRQPETGIFRREGQYWTLAYTGSTVRLKDTKGLQYLAHLLRHPDQEFLALDLVTELSAVSDQPSAAHQERFSIHESQRTNTIHEPVLDAHAKAEYRARLHELRDELEEAEGFNDLGRMERLQAEIDFISEQLSAAVGLHGKDRKVGTNAERARLTVTKRIKDALKTIGKIHPPLAHHLRACVKTGYVCTYTPPPDEAVAWKS